MSVFSCQRSLSIFGLIALLLAEAMPAQDVAKPALRILRDQCVGCHKPGKAKGGLLLTSGEKLNKGGDSGAVMLPGKADDSLLFQVLLEGGDPHMPPKKQLSAADIAAIKAWINAGGAWDSSVFDEAPIPKAVKMGALPETYQPVLALALSPDEKKLAAARGNSVVLVDLAQAARPTLAVQSGQPEPVQSLAWSPDGKWLVTGGYQRILVWDVATVKPVREIHDGLLGNITAITFDASGAALFVADGESGGAGFLRKFELAQGKLLATWKAHEDTIYALRLSPKGDRLLSGSADKLAKLWDTGTLKLVSSYEGHTNHVLAVAFNKDASQIATTGADREVKVWDVASREQDVSLGDKKIVFSGLYWTPDGRALGVVTDKGGGSVFTELQKHTGEQRSEAAKERKLAKVNDTLTSVVLTADGKTVFAGGFQGKVFIWDAAGKVAGEIAP